MTATTIVTPALHEFEYEIKGRLLTDWDMVQCDELELMLKRQRNDLQTAPVLEIMSEGALQFCPTRYQLQVHRGESDRLKNGDIVKLTAQVSVGSVTLTFKQAAFCRGRLLATCEMVMVVCSRQGQVRVPDQLQGLFEPPATATA